SGDVGGHAAARNQARARGHQYALHHSLEDIRARAGRSPALLDVNRQIRSTACAPIGDLPGVDVAYLRQRQRADGIARVHGDVDRVEGDSDLDQIRVLLELPGLRFA